MKLIMTIPVDNKEYIIGENLYYHTKLGIDGFVILLHKSKDGSKKIINSFKKIVPIFVYEKRGNIFLDGQWRTEMAMLAKKKLRADWVISNDADEFWLLNDLNSSIKKVLETSHENVVYTKRYNVLPYSDDSQKPITSPPRNYTYVVTGPTFKDKEISYKELTPLDYLLKAAAGKAACKTDGLASIDHGSHEIKIRNISSIVSNKLFILHYPIFSKEVFIKESLSKVKSMLKNRKLKEGQDWRIKFLQYLIINKRLEEFSSGLFLQEPTIKRLIEQKIISQNKALHNFFRNKVDFSR